MTSELKKDVDILTDKYGGDIHIIDIPPVDVSSSKIRDNIENGLAINGMVDSRVMDYIEKYGLYRG